MRLEGLTFKIERNYKLTHYYILETTSENIFLRSYIKGNTLKADITNIIDQFIHDCVDCNIENWNDEYIGNVHIFGQSSSWELQINYDDNLLIKRGNGFGENSFPKEIDKFMKVLNRTINGNLVREF